MKALSYSIALAGIVAVLSTTVSAQWPEYKKPNAPRLPDGKVDAVRRLQAGGATVAMAGTGHP